MTKRIIHEDGQSGVADGANTPETVECLEDKGELLSDEQIRQALKDACDGAQLYGDDGLPIPEKQVALDQRDLTASFYQSKINEAYDLLESNASFWKDGGVVIVLNKSEWASLKARYQKGVK